MTCDFELGQNYGVIGDMFLSSDLDEIRYVGRGRWVVHNGMTFDPIQGQGQEPLDFEILAIFRDYFLRHLLCEQPMTMDS